MTTPPIPANLRHMGSKPLGDGTSRMTLGFRSEAALSHAHEILPPALAGDPRVTVDREHLQMRLPIDGRVKTTEFSDFLKQADASDAGIAAFKPILANAVAQAQGSEKLANLGIGRIALTDTPKPVPDTSTRSAAQLGQA